jgi:hypothetical protein
VPERSRPRVIGGSCLPDFSHAPSTPTMDAGATTLMIFVAGGPPGMMGSRHTATPWARVPLPQRRLTPRTFSFRTPLTRTQARVPHPPFAHQGIPSAFVPHLWETGQATVAKASDPLEQKRQHCPPNENAGSGQPARLRNGNQALHTVGGQASANTALNVRRARCSCPQRLALRPEPVPARGGHRHQHKR